MATLRSELILGLRDRVTRPSRGVCAAIGGLRRDTEGFGRSQMAMAGGIGRSVRNLALLGAGYFGVTAGIGGALRGTMDFETAMADLAKKSSLTDHQLVQMGDRITELSNSMPLARTEIAQLVAQAAQFGIANEELERFAMLGAKAAVAFDMSGAEAAESLSQLKNALDLDMTGLEGLADMINATADSAGTSEQSLIDFMLRTAATAQTFGVSNEALAAFGASLNEIGIRSQVGATGMKAMLTRMSALTDNKDAVALLDRLGGEGYSARLQREFYQNPIEALEEMMRLTQQMNSEQQAGFFQDMFGMEYGDDAAAIANNIDTIAARMDKLADSTAYAGSVQETYSIFANTSAEKMKILSNNVSNLAAAAGAVALGPIVDFTDRLAETLGTLPDRVTIFDQISAGLKGINAGLGLDPGQGLASIFNAGWAGIFGDTASFEEDTDNLARIFYKLRDAGAAVRSFGNDIHGFAGQIAGLVGVDTARAADTLKTVAIWGVGLWAAAAPIRLVAGAIRGLAKALFVLSGASMLFGGAKGIRNLFRSLRGAGALAGAAGGAAAGAGARRAAGGGAFRASRLMRGLGPVGAALGMNAMIGRGSNEMPTANFEEYVDQRLLRRATNGGPDRAMTDTRRATRARTDASLMWHGRGLAELARRTNGGPDGARASIQATRREAQGLGDNLDQINTTPIRPTVDTGSLDQAITKADLLDARLRSINVQFGDINIANRPGGTVDEISQSLGERTERAIRSAYTDAN